MTSFYDATKITGIIPIPRFFNSGSYKLSDWKAQSPDDRKRLRVRPPG